jgi:hypothetical protein
VKQIKSLIEGGKKSAQATMDAALGSIIGRGFFDNSYVAGEFIGIGGLASIKQTHFLLCHAIMSNTIDLMKL